MRNFFYFISSPPTSQINAFSLISRLPDHPSSKGDRCKGEVEGPTYRKGIGVKGSLLAHAPVGAHDFTLP